MPDQKQPLNVPSNLLVNPWREQDEIIREFFFDNEASFQHDVDVEYAEYKASTVQTAVCFCLWPFYLLQCMACHDYRKPQMLGPNKINDLYRRRIAVSKKGVIHKLVPMTPFLLDPADNCAFNLGYFKANERPAATKTIPFDQIQNIDVTLSSGATIVKGFPFICMNTSIIDVDSLLQVDTAGHGIELEVAGLVDASLFRDTVMAMKHGEALPEITSPNAAIEGQAAVEASSLLQHSHFSRVNPSASHSDITISSFGATRQDLISGAVVNPTNGMEMEFRGGNRSSDLVPLLNEQNTILREHTLLLKQIAGKK